ncbi:MAG: hypothetical protein ACKOD8_04005 [Limnohabitans sp.]
MAGDLKDFTLWLAWRLHQQIHMRVARYLQPPLGAQLGLEINRAAGAPKQVNVAPFALVIGPGAKKQHLALRVNRPQDAGDGLVLGGGQAHRVLAVIGWVYLSLPGSFFCHSPAQFFCHSPA